MRLLRLRSFFAVVCVAHAALGKRDYSGYELFRLRPTTEQQIDYLKDLETGDNAQFSTVDFWVGVNNAGIPVDVLLSADESAKFREKLTELDINYTVQIKDLQSAIETEKSSDAVQSSSLLGIHRDATFRLDRYNRYGEIQAFMYRLEELYPERVSVRSIGETHDRHDLTLVKVGTRARSSSANRPAVWIDGGIHAREWISPATVVYFVEQLATGYERDDDIRQLVDSVDFYILPVLNPDGYEHSHTTDRMWRKNRRPRTCQDGSFGFGRRCCSGVDLNRNFDWHWASTGSSNKPCSETYHGPRAFSEPESAAVRDFVAARAHRFKAFFTIHSYSQVWMYPYGHRRRSYPPDLADIKSVASKATRAIESVQGTRYKTGTGADIMYSAAGGSDDWAKGIAGVKFAYLIELPPSGVFFSNGFILPESEIFPVASESWAGVRAVAEEVSRRYTATKPVRPVIVGPGVESTTTIPCIDWSVNCPWFVVFGHCHQERVKTACPKSCNFC